MIYKDLRESIISDDICFLCGGCVVEAHKCICDIMQYTGLKDSQGKEIYEGDILQLEWGYNFKKSKEVKKLSGEIIYEEDKFCLKINDDMNHLIPTDGKCEVIGNVYEHPELLKKEASDDGS